MTIDQLGNQHAPAGNPGGGRFTGKTNAAPNAALADLTGILPVCPRHGGDWGDDLTCEGCTTDSGDLRPVPEDSGLPEPVQPTVDEVRHATDQVRLRSATREVSDDVARIIALDALANIPSDVGTHEDFPMLHRVAATPGYPWSEPGRETEVDELHSELTRIYRHWNTPWGRKDRVNALYTFSLHGGDNT